MNTNGRGGCQKRGFSKDEAFEEIRNNLGTQFDPELGCLFFWILKTRCATSSQTKISDREAIVMSEKAIAAVLSGAINGVVWLFIGMLFGALFF